MKFALDQMRKLYGASKQQAIDKITKLTMKLRLEALRQADDRLKRKDALRAKKQAAAIKLSLQDEWDAAHQATDSRLSKLRIKDEVYAAAQTSSQFAGKLTDDNEKIAQKLVDKASAKRERFLLQYREWEEKKREAKIRAKYAKEREVMLGESGGTAVHHPKIKKAKKKKIKHRRSYL